MVSAKHIFVLWPKEQGVGELWGLFKKKKKKPSRGTWVAHSVKRPTLDF